MTSSIDELRRLAPEVPAVSDEARLEAEATLRRMIAREEPRRRRPARAPRSPRFRRRLLVAAAIGAAIACVALVVPALLDEEGSRVPQAIQATFALLGPEDARAAARELRTAAAREAALEEGTVVTVVRFVHAPSGSCESGQTESGPDYRETFAYAGASSYRDTEDRALELRIIDIRTPEQMYIWSSDYPDGGRDADGERRFKTIPPDPQADANVIAWTLGGVANQAIADLVASGERLAKREQPDGSVTYRSTITVGALLDGIPRRERPEVLEWFTSFDAATPLHAEVTIGENGLFSAMSFAVAQPADGFCEAAVSVDLSRVGRQTTIPVPTGREIAGPHA
jgi:hypothetical protein